MISCIHCCSVAYYRCAATKHRSSSLNRPLWPLWRFRSRLPKHQLFVQKQQQSRCVDTSNAALAGLHQREVLWGACRLIIDVRSIDSSKLLPLLLCCVLQWRTSDLCSTGRSPLQTVQQCWLVVLDCCDWTPRKPKWWQTQNWLPTGFPSNFQSTTGRVLSPELDYSHLLDGHVAFCGSHPTCEKPPVFLRKTPYGHVWTDFSICLVKPKHWPRHINTRIKAKVPCKFWNILGGGLNSRHHCQLQISQENVAILFQEYCIHASENVTWDQSRKTTRVVKP